MHACTRCPQCEIGFFEEAPYPTGIALSTFPAKQSNNFMWNTRQFTALEKPRVYLISRFGAGMQALGAIIACACTGRIAAYERRSSTEHRKGCLYTSGPLTY